MTPPIKKCDYCEAVGKMPTFMNGETMCNDCLIRIPTNSQECRKRIVELENEIVRLADIIGGQDRHIANKILGV